tara:strand:- start:160 stop:717 length:558 start_codon:yes stop_codon:yes gene_type:complete
MITNNKIKNNQSATIWISGVTASGKTTLGKFLFESLNNNGIKRIKFFDGEDLRKRLDKNYGHSLADRYEVLNGIIKIVKEETIIGYTVIISTVSHKREMRDLARSQSNHFMEINLICSSKTCAIRDYKNIYNTINEKNNECLPGVTEPYEISDNAELILDTEQYSLEESKIIILNTTLKFLNDKN